MDDASVKVDAATASKRRATLLAGTISAFLAAWDRTAAARSPGTASPKKQPAKSKDPKKSASKKSTAKTTPQPQDEVITKLMQDLDEKINKAKRCNLEDLYTAIAGLETHQQQALSSIITACSSKLLPEKGGSAATVAIRDILVAAAAAHSYRRPQTPEASKSSAAAFRQQGLDACSALQAGFHAGQLLRAGYSTAELVQSGVPLDKLRAAGVSVSDLYRYLPAQEAAQLSGTSGAARLKAAGYTVTAVQEGAAAGAFSAWDLALAGYADAHTGAAAETSSLAAGPSSLQVQGSSRQASLQHQAQQQGLTRQQPAAAEQDVEYFRHQVVPLMHMKAEQHTPPLLHRSTQGPGVGITTAVAASAATAQSQLPASQAPRAVLKASQQQRVKWQLQQASEGAAAQQGGGDSVVQLQVTAAAAAGGGEASIAS